MSRPWIKWYPTDWRADPRLRMCSLSARGLWIELIGYMHEGEPYGHLTINNNSPNLDDIAALVGRPFSETKKAMAELEKRQVFSADAQGIFYSRRMVRDKAKDEKDRENGKGGGNPQIKTRVNGRVNPSINGEDKAQKPEAREPDQEKKDAADAAIVDDPKTQFYRRFEEVLGKNSGGFATQVLKASGGSIPKARALLETSSIKANAREYLGRIVAAPKRALTPEGQPYPEGII